MISTYDLLLQPATRGAPVDVAAVEAAFEARGAKRGPAGQLTLLVGKVEIAVGPLREAGVVVAEQARLPLQSQTDFLGPALQQLLALAAAQNLVLHDPMLNRTLKETDAAVLEESYARTAAYAGEFLGVGDALGAVARPVPEGLQGGSVAWLALVVFLVAAWLAYVWANRGS